MSLKVLKIGWEIENRIKNMNKAEIVSYMLGFLNQAETNANDNKTVVRHSCFKIKEKLQSVDKEELITYDTEIFKHSIKLIQYLETKKYEI